MPRRLENRMWTDALAMLERAERLQRRFFEPATRRARGWQPPADVYETERHVWVIVALPGADAAALDVRLRANWLEIHGTRPLAPQARQCVIHRLELPHGEFHRRLELPPFVYELEGRRFADGCLYLQLRKL